MDTFTYAKRVSPYFKSLKYYLKTLYLNIKSTLKYFLKGLQACLGAVENTHLMKLN